MCVHSFFYHWIRRVCRILYVLVAFFCISTLVFVGILLQKNNLLERLSIRPKRRFFVLFVSVIVIAVLVPFIYTIPKGLLYGASSYSSCQGTLYMRGIVSIVSLCMILFLCVGVRPYLSRKFILITKIGQNTWPIFLLHGFVIKAVPVYFPHLVSSPWYIILLSCALVILTGNRLCQKAIYYTCFSWLGKHERKSTYMLE